MKQQMTPEELAESVKRLRDIYACHNDADVHELMFAVNALVDLVGELSAGIHINKSNIDDGVRWAGDFYTMEHYQSADYKRRILAETLTKSAPIAALAKEGE